MNHPSMFITHTPKTWKFCFDNNNVIKKNLSKNLMLFYALSFINLETMYFLLLGLKTKSQLALLSVIP